MSKLPTPNSAIPNRCWGAARGTVRPLGRWLFWELGVVLLLLAACAPKTVAPAAVTTPQFADVMYPAVPQALQNNAAAPLIERGWRYLQSGDLGNAERDFATALKGNDSFQPAHAGQGDVALARRNFDRALTDFDAALRIDRDYVPALVGRGQALLALKRDEDALAAFERAVALDGSLADVRRRIDVLRFRDVQDVIARARSAAAAGRIDEARTAYERAIAASPDSAFLYHELGELERAHGDSERALEHLRKAADLDPTDTTALVDIGGLLEGRQDFAGAIESYRRAARQEPSAQLDARIAAATANENLAKLPPEFRAIGQSPQVTRGELAALIGIRLEPILRQAPQRQVVATDIRNQWAASWITAVLDAAVMDVYQNHTFQPQGRVRRGDLATAVSRVLDLIAERRPQLIDQLKQRPKIADMSTTHLDYPAAAVSVATGVLPLSDGRFQVSRAVTGAEAVDAIDRLRALANIR